MSSGGRPAAISVDGGDSETSSELQYLLEGEKVFISIRSSALDVCPVCETLFDTEKWLHQTDGIQELG